MGADAWRTSGQHHARERRHRLAGRLPARCLLAASGIAASGVGSASARPCGLARASAAVLGRAESRHASDPVPAERRHPADRVRVRSDTTAVSTGPAVAGDERAAPAVGERRSANVDHAFGRDHAGHAITGAGRQYQVRTAAIDRCKTSDTIIAFSRDNVGDAVTRAGRQCQVWNAALTTDDCNNALSRDRAGSVNTGARRRRQPHAAALANTGCEAVATHPLSGGHAGRAVTGVSRKRQARNVANTYASYKAFAADYALSGDHTRRAIAWRQRWNAGTTRARWKADDTIGPTCTDKAGHGLALAASGRRR